MSLTVSKILLGWNEDDERRHQDARKRKHEAARALLEGSAQCSHSDKFKVCVWNLDCNDNDGKSWDGAYSEFCPDCRKFASEMTWGMKAKDGKPFYVEWPPFYPAYRWSRMGCQR